MTSTLLIPWEKSKIKEHAETIKWSRGNTKYEIYIPVLEDLELMFLLPHCLDAKEKIEQVVSDLHLGSALFQVFPPTISTVLKTIWVTIIHDEHPAETAEAFNQCLRTFIGSHSTEEDRHDLVTQLRAPRKPHAGISVQSFYYRLREVNGYIEWLPGIELPLNQDQLKQAFFDSMPTTWRDCFDEAGHSSSQMTLAEVLRYFRKQESVAIRKQFENNLLQRGSSKRFVRKDTTTAFCARSVIKPSHLFFSTHAKLCSSVLPIVVV
jgi:hypothetical protein